jgi:hypothetical protein
MKVNRITQELTGLLILEIRLYGFNSSLKIMLNMTETILTMIEPRKADQKPFTSKPNSKSLNRDIQPG